MLTKILQLGFNTLDSVFARFFPNLVISFDAINDFFDNVYAEYHLIQTFRGWLGYVFFFVPWSFLKPFILAVISLFVIRIAMALVRVITDLL